MTITTTALTLPTTGGETTPLGYTLPDDMRDYRPHHHAQMLGAVISYRDLPGNMIGASTPAGMPLGDGKAWDVPVIWIDRLLSPLRERCTLTHELVHIESGHKGRQTTDVEHQVNGMATRWLTSRKMLRWALKEAGTPLELELLLGIDPRSLRCAAQLWPDVDDPRQLLPRPRGGLTHPVATMRATPSQHTTIEGTAP